MSAIETFQDFQKTVTRNNIRIKYQNVEYNAFLVKVEIINDDDIAITVSEHVELWFNNAWLFLQLIDVTIVNDSSTTGGTTNYEGDVTIIEHSDIQYATTINGDSIYGVWTLNEDGSYNVDWFNMDGSPYTGDLTNLSIVVGASTVSIEVFQRLILINAERNLYFAFIEVLTFNASVQIAQAFTTYNGAAINVDASLIVEAPVSVIVTNTYTSDNYFDFSEFSNGLDVVNTTINITNSIKRVNGVVVRSSAILYLHNTEELVTFRRKTWQENATVGRRCGTKPKVRCYDGATMVCDIQREIKATLTRDKAVYDQSQATSFFAT